MRAYDMSLPKDTPTTSGFGIVERETNQYSKPEEETKRSNKPAVISSNGDLKAGENIMLKDEPNSSGVVFGTKSSSNDRNFGMVGVALSPIVAPPNRGLDIIGYADGNEKDRKIYLWGKTHVGTLVFPNGWSIKTDNNTFQILHNNIEQVAYSRDEVMPQCAELFENKIFSKPLTPDEQTVFNKNRCQKKICESMKEKYGVIPLQNWGKMPEELRKLWSSENCDQYFTLDR